MDIVHKLVFGHKMILSNKLEIKVDTVVSNTFKDYEKLKKNLQYMGDCRNSEVKD